MGDRLKDKVAIVVGAGQTPGETMGNGRATAIVYAREGAKVLLVDRRLESALDTQAMIEQEGGVASSFAADATSEADCKKMTEACVERYGRIDILHNNVGIGDGDSGVTGYAGRKLGPHSQRQHEERDHAEQMCHSHYARPAQRGDYQYLVHCRGLRGGHSGV